jgi:hypothetical protein
MMCSGILPQSSFLVQVWLNFPTRIHHVLIRLGLSVEIRKAGRQRTSYDILSSRHWLAAWLMHGGSGSLRAISTRPSLRFGRLKAIRCEKACYLLAGGHE